MIAQMTAPTTAHTDFTYGNTVGHGLLPAWDDPVHDAQLTFRCVLQAMSEPGRIQTIPVALTGPAPLFFATTALCLALADFETALWLDRDAATPDVETYLRFHCGCPLAGDMAQAAFAVITDASQFGAELTLARFSRGTMEYPDRSATLLVQVPTLTDGPARYLTGPGIAAEHEFRVEGLPSGFELLWQENVLGFPLGVDVVFCCGQQILGLPRTTQLQVRNGMTKETSGTWSK